jgi:hypothetical protein
MPKRVANSGSFAKGVDPRRNTTKPGPGRTPEAFKRWCRKTLSRKEVAHAMRDVVQNKNHPQFMSASKMLASYAYGMPGQTLEVKGKLSLEQILARSWQPKKKAKKKRKGTSR